MKNNIIRIIPEPVKLPKCQGMRISKYISDRKDIDKHCKRSATYQVNGINYCKPHAGNEALRLLMIENTNKVEDE